MIKKTMFEFGSMSLWDRFFRSHRDDQPLGTLVSFPKSGRTWVRVMLDRLIDEMSPTAALASRAKLLVALEAA